MGLLWVSEPPVADDELADGRIEPLSDQLNGSFTDWTTATGRCRMIRTKMTHLVFLGSLGAGVLLLVAVGLPVTD